MNKKGVFKCFGYKFNWQFRKYIILFGIITQLGNDSFGKDYIKSLASNGVNMENVKLTDNVPSGMAQITVANNGKTYIKDFYNSILIRPKML